MLESMPTGPERQLQFEIVPLPAGQLSQFVLECKSPPLPPRKADGRTMPVPLEKSGAVAASGKRLFETLDVIAHYQSIAGNLPNQYKNNIALWKALQPNVANQPLKTLAIGSDSPSGDIHFPGGVEQTGYCITYQCGEPIGTMCAMATIPLAPPSPSTLTTVSMEIRGLTSASITILYRTLPNYNPQQNRNWVGIWPGTGIPYPPAPDPVASSQITSPYNEYIVQFVFEPLPLAYTLAYFTGPDRSNIAAALCFNVQGS
jgi:hypothetical protein